MLRCIKYIINTTQKEDMQNGKSERRAEMKGASLIRTFILSYWTKGGPTCQNTKESSKTRWRHLSFEFIFCKLSVTNRVRSACCCSCSCTLRQISPATSYTLPTLVKRAAILSLRRKPAALRFNECPRQASVAARQMRRE